MSGEHTTDHDLLIRIDTRVDEIRRDLKTGTDIMHDHEKRLQQCEKADTQFVLAPTCAASHKAMTRNFIVLLISVITALIGIVATLLKKW